MRWDWSCMNLNQSNDERWEKKKNSLSKNSFLMSWKPLHAIATQTVDGMCVKPSRLILFLEPLHLLNLSLTFAFMFHDALLSRLWMKSGCTGLTFKKVKCGLIYLCAYPRKYSIMNFCQDAGVWLLSSFINGSWIHLPLARWWQSYRAANWRELKDFLTRGASEARDELASWRVLSMISSMTLTHNPSTYASSQYEIDTPRLRLSLRSRMWPMVRILYIPSFI